MMDRRAFIGTVAGGLLAVPLSVDPPGQESRVAAGRGPRILGQALA
jgi:hypothetical protein